MNTTRKPSPCCTSKLILSGAAVWTTHSTPAAAGIRRAPLSGQTLFDVQVHDGLEVTRNLIESSLEFAVLCVIGFEADETNQLFQVVESQPYRDLRSTHSPVVEEAKQLRLH